MNILNAPYSFVQFNNTFDTTLPLEQDTDLKFQVVMSGTKGQCDTLMSTNVYLHTVRNTIITSDAEMTANTLLPATNFFSCYRISETKVLLYWPHGLQGLNGLTAGQCLRVAFKVDGAFYNSNVFNLDVASRFTSTLEYSCDEDSNGFYYCFDDLPNKIRLPLYIAKPQYQDSEEIYTRSGGQIDILNSVTKKEYSGKTEYLPDEIHCMIKIALSSDNIDIESHFYTGGIRKNGNYDIAWPDGFLDEVGQAEFKVFATPFNVRNNNCVDCGEEWSDDGCNITVADFSVTATGLSESDDSFNFTWSVTGYGTAYTFWNIQYSADGGVTWTDLPGQLDPTDPLFSSDQGYISTNTSYKFRLIVKCHNDVQTVGATIQYL